MRHSTLTGSDGPLQPRTIRLAGVLVASVLAALACGDSKIPTQQSATDDTTENDDGNAETTTSGDASSVSGYATTDGPVDPPDDSCFVQIEAGGGRTCALKVDGTMWCWGRNSAGQLGLGHTDGPVPEPTQATVLAAEIREITTGGGHTCAIKTDSTAWCWGFNDSGQVGDGTLIDRTTPIQVTALGNDAVQLSAGDRATCGVRADGTLWCWGYGPLVGVGLPAHQSGIEPTQVTALGTDVVQTSVAGQSHACALRANGSLWCWGRNVHGQVGDGTTEERLEPVEVTAVGRDVREVRTRGSGTCVVKNDGTVWCWGRNLYGQVGDGTDGPSNTPKLIPVQIPGLVVGDRGLSVSVLHGCAVDTDGALWCWGKNEHGLIGDGEIDTTCEIGGDWTCLMNRPEPVRVALDAPAVEVTTALHTCVRLQDDTVWCWGESGAGQLGDGTLDGEDCPSGAGTTPCTPSPVRALIGCP
jgi:alpha-tubulin suppressor-like RCC1 family protein